MNWRCALSCSSMLIPLLLTSLEDESPSNREEIWQIWNEVGKKWLVEELDRDHRLKEQVDFQAEAPPPSHYPPESKTKVLFFCIYYSGVFSTGATGALAPVILGNILLSTL